MRKTILFLSIIIIVFTDSARSQTQGVLGKRFFDNWSIGISGGPNVFFGDLKVNRMWPASQNMNEWRMAGSINVIRQLSHVFSLRGQMLYGQIAGTKRNYTDGAPCNQYFEGYLAEPNLNVMVNFMNIFGYNPARKFFIYGTVGLGMTFWHTKKYDLVTHAKIGEAGKAFPDWTKEAVIPAGLGAYYNIGDKVNLGLEWTLRGLNSDRLDATEGGFQYDMYSLLSVNLTYNFNKPNPGKLNVPNMGKNMGPVPSAPAFPITIKPTPKPKSDELYQQRPSLQSPGKKDTLHLRKRDEKKVVDSTRMLESESGLSIAYEDIQAGPVVPGLSYRVQIYAFKADEYTADNIRAKFRIRNPVYKEYTEGWYRYTAGSFKTLKAARAYLGELKTKNKVRDAFVARYKDGIRIPTHPKP